MWRKRNFTSREYIPQRIESRSLKRYCTFIFLVALLLYVLSRSVMSDSMGPRGLQPTRFLCPWGFSRQESWSGLPCPPPGDLPNPGLLRCRQILYWLSHQGSPRILEWVVCPFFRVSSRSRNRLRVSCITGSFSPAELPWKPGSIIGSSQMVETKQVSVNRWMDKQNTVYTCCCLVTESCPTFCDALDSSPPCFSVGGVFQARILKWVAISFSRRSSWSRDWNYVSCIGW